MKTIYASVAMMTLVGCTTLASAMPNDPDTTPGNEGFCQNYAASTSKFVAKVLEKKPSCLDVGKGVHADYNMHLTWCRYTPRTNVEGAARHIRDLANRCLGVGSAPRGRTGATAGGGCPAPGSVRSLNSNRPAVIHFANSTGRPLKIYWLDFQGQRKFYRELKTGQDYMQPTYLTHPWIAVDRAGNCVDGVLKASKPGENLMEIFGDVRD